MGLVLGSYALGRHAFFFQEGQPFTVPTDGTCGVNSKPGATDPDYIDLGPIVDWEEMTKTGKTEEIWIPSPGVLQLYDEVDIKVKRSFKCTLEQVQALVVQIFYRTSTILTSAGGQFNPDTAQPPRAWFHTELYDQNNNFFGSLDAWGRARITGGISAKDGGLMRPELEFTVYQSELYTAEINND